MKKLISISLVLLTGFSAFAEGYQVNTQSTKQLGMGHVGTAMKLGAESMHFNPAGMGFMTGHVDLSAGATGIFTKATYENEGYKAKTDNSISTPLFGYAAFRIYDNLKAGVSITTPYGSSMNWGKDWKGATLVQDISLKSFVFQPTLAYKIADQLSIGAGLMVAKGSVELSRALLPKGAYPKYPDIIPVSATLTGKSKIGLGYNVGLMYDINDQWTIGASYRSKMMMKVDAGTAVLNYASDEIKQAFAGKVPPLDQGTFKSELPLPANLNFGVTYRPNAKLLLSADFQGTGWKAYDKLDLKFTENVLNGYSILAEKKYKNTFSVRAGTQYSLTERFDIRSGVYVDTTPVREDYYNPETPGMTKLGLSAGFSFYPVKGFSVDFAFLYIQGLGKDGAYTSINPLSKKPETFKGHYTTVAFSPSLGLSYNF